MTAEKLSAKRIRTCSSIHECSLCGENIIYGEDYHDGGHGNRAHCRCVEIALEKAEKAAGEKRLGEMRG
jgi:hypothetical protein